MLVDVVGRIALVLVLASIVAFAPVGPGDPATPWRLVVAILFAVFGIGKALYDTLFHERHQP